MFLYFRKKDRASTGNRAVQTLVVKWQGLPYKDGERSFKTMHP
jgi:hypothetical protein